MENTLDYKSMNNKITDDFNYLPSSLEDVNLELFDGSSKIITVHNLPNSIENLYTFEVLVKKIPQKLKYLSIFDYELNFIKRLPKGLLKIGIYNLKMKLIKKEFKILNKNIIENLEDDSENLYGKFLEDNLNYVGKNVKYFTLKKNVKLVYSIIYVC